MLLKELKLQNIRSYLNETLNLSAGSTLLAGDIGCGKSTLLLAIEFALFGTSRPDLPGEALLRKGSIEGSVELKFQLQNQDYWIKRGLKKEKDSIKQTNGYFITQGLKKELTPVELKSEIINLLGYPEEILTKNKNYLYRYTVYCPQEEMKLILQEEAELRLDVLRKIFNLDKYKIIRENLSFYLKQLRARMAVLEARIQPLEEEKKRFQKLSEEQELLSKSLIAILPELEKIKSLEENEKKILESLELRQKKSSDLKNQHKNVIELFQEKNLRHSQLLAKKESIQKQLSELILLEEVNPDKIQLEIKELELNKNQFISKKTFLQERIRQIQLLIKEAQQEVIETQKQISKIPELENKKNQLSEEISQKSKIKDSLLKQESENQDILEQMTKTKLILSQSKELKDQICCLENCPTCLQKVPAEHKTRIFNQEEEKIIVSEKELNSLTQNRGLIQKEIFSLKEQLEQLNAKESLLARISQELGQLVEKKEQLQKKESQIGSWKKEESDFQQELLPLMDETRLILINQSLQQFQEQLNQLSKKQYLDNYLKEFILEIFESERQLTALIQQKERLDLELSQEKEDLGPLILEKKKQLNLISLQERDLSIKQAQLRTQISGLQKQSQHLEEMIEVMNTEKNKLLRIKDLYHWMDEYLLNLTYTIEKQMMVNIHHLFNQFFQEWFSILMDDEAVSAKIDDSFTPIVEQNGYEINFINLSGGEKTSCALAYRLALNKVINDIVHEIKTKDLLILDEPTDGFSSEQLDKVREVLDKLGLGQIIIVSHEAKIETFVENVVRVRKEGNVSMVA